MALMKSRRREIVQDAARHDSDTGSPEVQVSILTERIAYLTEHLKVHRKDFHSKRGLLNLVSKRHRQLEYLKKSSPERYKVLIEKLGIRK